VCEECAISAKLNTSEKAIDQAIAVPSETPMDQAVEWTLLHVVTRIDDIVMVEDISDDEEAIPQK
jgi:hypothetical protein